MLIEQMSWTTRDGWRPALATTQAAGAQLVFVFGASSQLASNGRLESLRARYPQAHFFGCSTAGEILDTQVMDDTIVATAMKFDHTRVQSASTEILGEGESRSAGQRLAEALPPQGLTHVLVLSDGLRINGSQLAEGLASRLPPDVAVTGGLAGDGARFSETLVVSGERVSSRVITVVGLYGRRLRVGYASLGGWDPFGPERIITRSSGNVLYELDGQSALTLYKRYLGEQHARDLPAAGLLFPLSLREKDDDEPIVRTILGVNENDQSMTFAGDMPTGARARLMKANFDRLIDGATGAARSSRQASQTTTPEFALLISCVGRKLVLKQRVEEEVEAVREVLGDATAVTGFYSYGEISPFTASARCQLHNQTMTITTLSES